MKKRLGSEFSMEIDLLSVAEEFLDLDTELDGLSSELTSAVGLSSAFFLKLASLMGFRSWSTHQIGYFSHSKYS